MSQQVRAVFERLLAGKGYRKVDINPLSGIGSADTYWQIDIFDNATNEPIDQLGGYPATMDVVLQQIQELPRYDKREQDVSE
jgi:hypothetical protein